jgi:transposase
MADPPARQGRETLVVAAPFWLSPAERRRLERWVRSPTSPQRLVLRSRIVLMRADGLAARETARRLGVAPGTVRLWSQRFSESGLESLACDRVGRGRPSRLGPAEVRRIEAALDALGSDWSVRSLAVALGLPPTTLHSWLRRLGHARR